MTSSDAIAKHPTHHWKWVWFAYTGFLFIDPIFEPRLWTWVGSIAALLIFCPIYAAYFRAVQLSSAPSHHHNSGMGNATAYRMIAATFVLGLLVYPWNSGGSAFFIYVASFLPFSTPSVRLVLKLFTAACAAVLLEGYLFHFTAPKSLFHLSWTQTLITLFLMITMGIGNIFQARQHRTEAKLIAAQDENIALAAVAERERIARDLHDVLGHTLSVVILKAELAGRLIPLDPARATAEIGDVERTARTALKEIREAIVGYRAHGLAAEIETARSTLDAAGVTLDAAPLPAGALSPQEETALSLALREAVTNIVRHAHATTCHLRWSADAGQRTLMIEDDGPHAIEREGNGLRGMRERIESLEGRLLIESGTENHRGTRLTLTLPLREGTAS
jgi:two-component system, NarL family, sensor histidine kinase DesK